ncbi:MAG: metallophosphoesterase [Kiritimatiellae bacterium]|nr:metallophosphoesterase [Kiritimatiellia bacterium]
MNISRLDFLRGSFSAAGLAAFGGVLPAKLFAGSAGTPNLVFGVVTDIHISLSVDKGVKRFEGAEMFRRALEYFRSQGVDGVAMCGDMADHGFINELEEVGRIWHEVFPGDRLPDGRHVEKLFVYGNHDREAYLYGKAKFAKKVFGKNYMKHVIASDMAGTWKKVFHEDYAPVWRKEVKGYTFVGAHWTAGRCHAFNEVGVPEGPKWLAANGATIDPAKPFFYLQHPVPKGTSHGPHTWGQDDGKSTEVLSRFRNAVAFSGHSHASLSDERAIWQGAFTAINASSLKYTGVEYGDVDPNGRENDRPLYGRQRKEDPYKIMSKMRCTDGHQGLLVKVFDESMTFLRMDFGSLAPLGAEWCVPLPAAEPMPFAFDRRDAAKNAPAFASGAALDVRMSRGTNRGGNGVAKTKQDVLEIEIPPASANPGTRAFDFEIEIADGSGNVDRRYVYAEKFYRAVTKENPEPQTVCRLAAKRLKAKGALKIEVWPRNSFGRRGKPLAASIRRDA